MYEKYAAMRNAKGVTDYEVSKQTGIPRSTFSEWKSGKSEPKLGKIVKLAQYFGTKIEDFLPEKM